MANEARRKSGKSGGSRRIDVVLPADNPLDSPSKRKKRKSEVLDRLDPSPRALKRRRLSNVVIEPTRSSPRSDLAALRLSEASIEKLEMRWYFFFLIFNIYLFI